MRSRGGGESCRRASGSQELVHWPLTAVRGGREKVEGVWQIYRASQVAPRLKDPPTMQETLVWSLGQEDPLEEGMASFKEWLLCALNWVQSPHSMSPLSTLVLKASSSQALPILLFHLPGLVLLCQPLLKRPSPGSAFQPVGRGKEGRGICVGGLHEEYSFQLCQTMIIKLSWNETMIKSQKKDNRSVIHLGILIATKGIN